MNKQNPDRVFLLIIGRRRKCQIQTYRKQNCRCGPDVRQYSAGQRHEFRRVGIAEHAKPLGRQDGAGKATLYPELLPRTAAAAARGLRSVVNPEKAASSHSAPLASPSSTPCTAPAPKITAGARSGKMMRGSISP